MSEHSHRQMWPGAFHAASPCPWRGLGLAFVLAFALAAAAEDWPQWRGPNRNGRSEETGWLVQWPAGGPKRLWEAGVGIGYSSFAVSRGRLYTMGNVADKDSVYCLDSETGGVMWRHEYACGAKDPQGYHGTRCTPTVDEDRVYSLSRQGHFFCLDAVRGTVKWAKNFAKDFGGETPTWGFAGSPLIEQRWVLTETGSGHGASVVALDKMTGEVVWRAGDDAAGYGSLIAYDTGGERCFAQFSKEHLIGRRMKDGTELWRQAWKTSYGVNAVTPIIEGDQIFVASGYNYGCARLRMSPTSVQEVWRNKNMRNHVNSCVLVDGHLYGYDEGELTCMDWKTGAVKWRTGSYGKGAVIFAGGKLILYGQTGKLGLAEATPDAFRESCSFQALSGQDTWANPVLANGRLYCRSLDKMVAFDVKPKQFQK